MPVRASTDAPPRRGRRSIALVASHVADADALDTLALPHPRGGQDVLFALSNRRLLELQRRKVEFGCWFVDDAAHANGDVVLATPYDARLSLLAILSASPTRAKFAPLDQVLGGAGHANAARLALDVDLGDLSAFCDEKDLGEGLRLVRLDDAKCVAWLTAKVRRVAATLAARAREDAAAPGAGFASASRGAAAAPDELPRRAVVRAVQAVCDYVADEWARRVADAFQIPLHEVFPGLAAPPAAGAENAWAHETEQQRLHELAFGSAAKRAKVDAAAEAAKPSTKSAALAKAAKGTKSITSFFGAKKKK